MLDECKRVLLKYSGEALAGDLKFGLDLKTMDDHAKQIKKLHERGVEIVLQIGGGNIFRGKSKSLSALPRNAADHIGIMSTVMNGIAMRSILENNNVETRLMSALTMGNICENYFIKRALNHLRKKRVVICVAGTGNPFFTTDTAAVLRAAELHCDYVLKGTIVDGVYSADPLLSKDSTYMKSISHKEVLLRDLKFMDTTGIVLAKNLNIPIIVFSMLNPSNLLGVFDGTTKYTLIK